MMVEPGQTGDVTGKEGIGARTGVELGQRTRGGTGTEDREWNRDKEPEVRPGQITGE